MSFYSNRLDFRMLSEYYFKIERLVSNVIIFSMKMSNKPDLLTKFYWRISKLILFKKFHKV